MLGLFNRPIEILDIFAFDVLHMPAVAEVAGGDLFAEGEVGITLDGDLVVEVEVDQVAEAQMPGQRGRLCSDPFHQVAIGTEPVNIVVKQFFADALLQEAGAHSHADTDGNPLAEGAGGRFNARCVTKLRVTGCRAVNLAEVFQIIQRETVS